MNRKELIAEVTTTLRQYDEANLIDYASLKLWVKTGLKRFGTNVMVLAEKVLEVNNGEADLPEDFWNLSFAVKCSPESHEFEKGCKQDIARTSLYYTQRIENTYEWDNQSNSHQKTNYKEVIERQHFGSQATVNFRYSNIFPLRLTRGIKKENIDKKCKNLIPGLASPYEINIVGEKIQANFNKGFIYLQYNALPTDEEGEITIPDVPTLEEYLMYYLKRRVLEDLWLNDDDLNLVNKISYISQKERESFALAMTTVKFEGLGNWDKKIKNKIRRETNRFENMFPNI